MSTALALALLASAALALIGFGPSALERRRRARAARSARSAARPARRYDPGRERRAERRARELLASVISAEDYAMYAELGFLSVAGNGGSGADDGSGYAYLVYPHRPIVAYDTVTGELLNEYCVAFPDRSEPALGSRLPDADDVLAKWMTLRGGERELIATANMHVPGRQVDPAQARRDLRRLAAWRSSRRRPSRPAAKRSPRSDPPARRVA